MTRRKHSPLHDRWTARVEGQIRHTIGQHPEWFSFVDDHARQACVNALAKRIVGEIVAAGKLAAVLDADDLTCSREADRPG